MAQLLKLAAFLLLLALGVQVRRSGGRARRRAVNRLLAYVLLVSVAAATSQQDAWPLTCHQIAVGRARSDSRVCQTQFYGLDGGGREWRLDPWTWTPVYDSILQFWLEQNLARLQPAQRRRVLAFLLARAERSRALLAAGRPLGYERLLGGAGAPYWLLLPRFTRVPSEPFAGLRVAASCWLPVERLADPERASHQLVTEYPAP
jgi:hypothetical protein